MIGERLVTRLSISFILLFLGGAGIVLGVTAYLTSNWLETAVDDNLHNVLETARNRLDAGGDPQGVLDDLSTASQFLELRDASGRLLGASTNLEGLVVPGFRRLEAEETEYRTTRLSRSRLRAATLPLRDADGETHAYLVAATTVPEVSGPLRNLVFVLVGVGVGGIALVLAGTLWLSNRLARPIGSLASSVRETTATGFRGEVTPPDGATQEVRELGEAIRDLVQRQREQLQRERAFFADSSHVLRTPLTALQANLELIQDAPPGERAEALAHARSALDSIGRTVNGLLLLARDQEPTGADWEVIELNALLADLVEEARLAAPELTIDLDPTGSLEVAGDRNQLLDLFNSVLENARRYTPAGGHVVVRLAREAGDRCAVEVQDDGIGLTEDEARQATERFFRGYQARKLFPGGSGLGLAIALRIAQLHGGQVTVHPNTPAGARVRVELPFLTETGFPGDPASL